MSQQRRPPVAWTGLDWHLVNIDQMEFQTAFHQCSSPSARENAHTGKGMASDEPSMCKLQC